VTDPRHAPFLALAVGVALAAACGDDDRPLATGGPPAGFATAMVDAHDAVRAGATPAPSPPLPPLLWSEDVAATAQAWADGCDYAHNPRLGEHSLGENIAATAPPGARAGPDIVALWASEAPFYDLAANTCAATDPDNTAGTCGHYTQLVWRSTTAVGCAVRTCTSRSPFGAASPAWDFWVCDYAPPGNVVGQRPY
jgi:pathogenesis-related protein 1